MQIGYDAWIDGAYLGFVYGHTVEDADAMAIRIAKRNGREHGRITLHQYILGDRTIAF
jgi:hypothetical protein